MFSFVQWILLASIVTLGLSIPVVDPEITVVHHATFTCAENTNTETLEHLIQFLQQQPCVQIVEMMNTKNHSKMKRNTDASGNIDVYALQTTINDHRTMINYLINNSINATYVNNAIDDHHSKTGPIFTSWRDLVDLLMLSCFLFGFIYYCICRTGISPCDKTISFCCRPIMARTATQITPEKSFASPVPNKFTPRPSIKRRPVESSVASLEGDIARYYTGYMSE